MRPCVTLMAECRNVPEAWRKVGGLRFEGLPLAWAGRESSKPGRGGGERWVVHAAEDWSVRHVDDPPAETGSALASALVQISGGEMTIGRSVVHRWRYAVPGDSTVGCPRRCLIDDDAGLIACGDWAGGGQVVRSPTVGPGRSAGAVGPAGGVEAAILSGLSAAAVISRSR